MVCRPVTVLFMGNQLTIMVVEALRNYETLSLNAMPGIPTGARLIGAMTKSTAEPPQRRFRTKIGAMANKFMQSKTSPILFVPDSEFVELGGGELPPSHILEILRSTVGNLGFRELDRRGRELRTQKRAFTQRILMAMLGGIALIVPMLIMTLLPGRNTALITVCITTFALGLVLAFLAKDSTGKDVLAATAAYAAVLVVFVGTSTNSPTPSG